VILRMLQPDFNIKTVYTIVRAKAGVSAASRLSPLLQPFLSSSPSQPARLVALTGDCSQPDLGLNAEDLKQLDNVSVVIHCAANTKFSLPLPYMLDTVTLLSYQMARFSLGRPSVKCHIDISSCFVGFNSPEGSVVPEAPLSPLEHEHANAYFQARAMTEGVVHCLGSQPSARNAIFSIARLSVVGPAAVFPFPGFGAGPASPLCAFTSSEQIPPDLYPNKSFLDVIPVDICSDQILAITASTFLAHNNPSIPRRVRVYNLAAGPNKKLLMPMSLLNETDIRVAKPSIPWKALLAAYRPQFEKTVYFDTKKSSSVFGLSPHSKTDAIQVDCSSLQVDVAKAINDWGGWKGYMMMIKKHMEGENQKKLAKRKAKL